MPKLDSSIIDTKSINLLASAKIFSVYDFIEADVDKLVCNSQLDAEAVLALKHKLITDYSAKPTTGHDLYLSSHDRYVLKTHIAGLDDLLEGGIVKGSIVELCGLAGCGKTQLSHSIALYSALHDVKVEYVDTKLDFSASRCNSLLPSNLCDKKMDDILENISVYNPKNIYDLLSTLDVINSKFKALPESEKLIIIDSLTAPYLPLVGISSNKGFSLLNCIASNLKMLASLYNSVVIITNLGVQYFESEEDELSKRTPDEIKPLLGKYWLHVPNTRIFVIRENAVSSKRTLFIKKSDYLQLNKTSQIDITEGGVR